MQSSSIPAKYLVPFAQNDSAKVEIPVTTADTTRASQSLGFPPRTMLPPEASGVPPQGEDFNGAMNQIARAAWWLLQGNGFPYDNTFATNVNIGGYAKGAYLPRADYSGFMLSLIDNNTISPDTAAASGTNDAAWAPGYNYGQSPITGIAGANVTLTLVQAAKDWLVLTGTLTASIQIIVPAWTKTWRVTNNVTMGAFTLTMKTTSGSGVILAAGDQCVCGDGTNIVQPPLSIPAATTATQAVRFSQVAGVVGTSRNAAITVPTATTTVTYTADELVVETALGGLRYCLANVSQTLNIATTGAGGMAVGSAPISGFVAVYVLYNPTSNTRTIVGVDASTAPVPETYGFAGYPASALVGFLPTNGSGQVVAGVNIVGRIVNRGASAILSGGGVAGVTSLSFAASAPRNAKRLKLLMATTNSTVNTVQTLDVASDSTLSGQVSLAAPTVVTSVGNQGSAWVDVVSTPNIYYRASNTPSSGAPSFSMYVTAFEF